MIVRAGTDDKEDARMDFKLEVVIVPVSDVDRAKAFYVEKAGFTWTSTTVARSSASSS